MLDDTPSTSDMISEIKGWLDYIEQENDNECLDLVEIQEIEEVFEIVNARKLEH